MKCTFEPLAEFRYQIDFLTTLDRNSFEVVIFFVSTCNQHAFFVLFMELFTTKEDGMLCGPFSPKLTLKQNLNRMLGKNIVFGRRKSFLRNKKQLTYLEWRYDKETDQVKSCP